jgi:hypothetical protein
MIHNSDSSFSLVYLLNYYVVYLFNVPLAPISYQDMARALLMFSVFTASSAVTWTFLSGSYNVGLTGDHNNDFFNMSLLMHSED